MKVAIWANSPSPHQRDFYNALREDGIDLRVMYLEQLRQVRKQLGWQQGELPLGEGFISDRKNPLEGLDDWQSRVHVIPGYSRRTFLSVARQLSTQVVPWVHWSENSRPSWRSAFSWTLKQWYARLVNRNALGAFAQGDLATEDFLRWGIRQEKISDLYYSVAGVSLGTPLDPLTRAFVRDKQVTFVFVGSLCRNKSCDVLLRAMSLVKQDRDDIGLVVVGDGAQSEEYKQLTKSLGLADQVLFHGCLPMSQVGAVLLCCDAFVLPSRYDGWGVVLNEAASAGLALIGSDRAGASHHLIHPGVNGFRFRAGSCRSLAAALQGYVQEPSLSKMHGRKSQHLFEGFTPRSSAERFSSSIYSWLCSDSRWSDWRHQWSKDSLNLPADVA